MTRAFVAAFVGAAAETLSSCGSATDHLQISSITTDVDATGGPRKGKPFTITLEGEMGEAHQHGVISGNLHLKALKFVDTDLGPWNTKYDFLPGLGKGSTKIQIGPFKFPRSIPGELDLSGRVTISNEKGEQVTCLDVALKIPQILDEEDPLELGKASCGDPSKDHITNIKSETVDGLTTSTMDLDEELGYVNLKVDLSVKAPLFPKVTVKLTQLPISISPAIPAGQLTFVQYPSDVEKPNGGVDVLGDLVLEGAAGDEVACIHFGVTDGAVSV